MRNNSIIALRSLIISFGVTAATTFVGVYGVILGASAAEMGWLQSSANSLANAGQLLWGRLSDRIGRRMPFIVLASAFLAVLWFLMAIVQSPVELIAVYALISLMGAMITVNWFSLIADVTDSSSRGHFLAAINNIGSVGTLVSVGIMIFLLHGTSRSALEIPFFAASASYVISAVIVAKLTETEHRTKLTSSLGKTFSQIREHPIFYKYFVAMNVQGYFWSMAWPLFPITIVSIMHFDLSTVALLTVTTLTATIIGQYAFGRIVDRVDRSPLIFYNRILLTAIPAMYAIFNTYALFLVLEVYGGLVGAIQSVVMNSYLMDIVPVQNRAEYISIMNGFNGAVYFLGALTGGYLLQFLLGSFGLRTALLISYAVVVAGRFGSSFLFLHLEEPERRERMRFTLYGILFRTKYPGLPSGSTVKPR